MLAAFIHHQRPLLSVVGPTATGKSSFVLSVAEKLLVDGYFPTVALISADSRQVYRGLEIVSGADIPSDFEVEISNQPHFVKKTIYGEVQLHGISMIEPNRSWSLAEFQQFALTVISETWQHGGLPIVVGGTGLYHDRLLASELVDMPGPDLAVRSKVAQLSISELQNWVMSDYPVAYAALTYDDQQNPRRLVRVLEKKGITEKAELVVGDAKLALSLPTQQLVIGLDDSIERIEQKIALRVTERLELGAVTEVQQLMSRFGILDLPILSATGVKELSLLIQEKVDVEQATQLWIRRERQYAKRQQSWWKKKKSGFWFDVSQESWFSSAQNQVLASFT